MRNPGGYAIWVDPMAPTVEMDTITCAHCNAVVFIKAMQDPSDAGGFCMLCYKHICPKCTDRGDCIPFEKKLDEYEKKTRMLGNIPGLVLD